MLHQCFYPATLTSAVLCWLTAEFTEHQQTLHLHLLLPEEVSYSCPVLLLLLCLKTGACHCTCISHLVHAWKQSRAKPSWLYQLMNIFGCTHISRLYRKDHSRAIQLDRSTTAQSECGTAQPKPIDPSCLHTRARHSSLLCGLSVQSNLTSHWQDSNVSTTASLAEASMYHVVESH